jgi:hypothetical protein
MVRVVTRPNRGGWSKSQTEERPIQDIREGDWALTYNSANCQLIRNGRQVLRTEARPYAGDLVRVVAGEQASRYTPEHTCLVRLARGFQGHHVYLMRRGRSYRIGRCQGWQGTQKTPGVVNRARTEGADAVWVLGAFDSAREASLAEATISWRYNIPGLTFNAGNQSTFMNQETIDRFWGSVGSLAAAAKAAIADHGRDEQLPIWAPNTNLGFWRERVTPIRAANLLDGMEVMAPDLARHPIVASREPYTGLVHSISVDKEATYFADGLLTRGG